MENSVLPLFSARIADEDVKVQWLKSHLYFKTQVWETLALKLWCWGLAGHIRSVSPNLVPFCLDLNCILSQAQGKTYGRDQVLSFIWCIQSHLLIMSQVSARCIDYIRPDSGISGSQAVCSIAEEWWILIINIKRGMQMFVISGFEVERSNTIIIPKARTSVEKGFAWILLCLGITSIQEINSSHICFKYLFRLCSQKGSMKKWIKEDRPVELEEEKDFFRRKVAFLKDRIDNTNGKIRKTSSYPVLKMGL